MQISIPGPAESTVVTITPDKPVILLGPNGSGKSRLGIWLNEHPDVSLSHRIAAQRSLELPEEVISETFDKAVEALIPDKQQSRRKPSQPQAMAYDFDQLVMTLFAEQTRALERAHATSSGRKLSKRPITLIDKLKALWASLLPHRGLLFSENSVRTVPSTPSAPTYNAALMSDGERVIFYLLGQALLVPAGGTLIVDEPELHISRALLGPLWDLIEGARRDCAFVYITHDLEFSVSRRSAVRYAVLDYRPGVQEPDRNGKRKMLIDLEPPRWTIRRLINAQVEEDILTLIVGSRRPILFVEGERGSLDPSIYRAVYGNFTVIPAGSCANVIRLVKSFNAQEALHWHSCAGLVDRDARRPYEDNRIDENVYVLPVSEVENLFLLPEIFLSVASLVQFDAAEAQQRLSRLEDRLYAAASRDSELVSLKRAIAAVHEAGQRFGFKAKTITDLTARYEEAFGQVRPEIAYAEFKALFDEAVAQRDWRTLLGLYDNKGLLGLAAAALDLADREALESLLTRSILTPEGSALLTALRLVLPSIPAQRSIM